MTDPRYDLVVVGGGPAGEKAAAQAAYWGKRVAVVERLERLGGTMVGGAVSSKTMREAALYLTGFKRREIYGAGPDLTPQAAVERLRSRTDQVEGQMSTSAAENMRRHGVDMIHGEARLGSGRTVVVQGGRSGDRILTADVILLATGSRPHHPDEVPFDDPDVLDSDAAARLDRPSKRLVVIGGGAVGCEFASIFMALGSEVTLVDSGPRLLAFMDREISVLLADAFRADGMRIVQDAGHPTVSRGSRGLEVHLASGEALPADKVVFAAGRSGNTDDLGLAEAGVETDARGRVLVDDRYRTSAPGVYAAGDVIGPPALASVSMEQARVAVCWAFEVPFKLTVDPLPPFGVYSIPEAAMLGMTEEAASAEGIPHAVGRARFATNTRAAIAGAGEGLVKLVFARDDLRLLGVHILGDAATELIHQGQAVMHFKGTLDYFIHSAFNVPTLSEAYKYAAYDGLGALRRD
jgi:NAD(P) transhydrogenase